MPTTILIADDHKIFRQGLESLLSSTGDFQLVGEAEDGLEAIALIRELRPEVAVIDVTMPKVTGLEVAKVVRRERLETCVVLLTMHRELDLAQQALAVGVAGYVLKDNAFDDLIFAIKQALQGTVFVSPALTVATLRGAPKVGLTRRERQVLSLVVAGYTSREIAQELSISIKTVETHRANLLQKLGASNSVEMTRLALEQGILNDTTPFGGS